MHKLCEKCDRNSHCKLGTHEYMFYILDSGCDDFREKSKSKNKTHAYQIGYAEGQRDAEQIKNEALWAKIIELEESISKFCRDCWAFRSLDAAQCRTCAFNKYKGEIKL